MAESVLILGGTGFVGSHLARELANEGHLHPIVASRSTAPGSRNGIESRRCDATDATALERALEGVDYVVETISGAPSALIAVRRTLIASRALRRLRGIILMSSAAVYGTRAGQFDEHSTSRPDWPHRYARAKAFGDQLFLAQRDSLPPTLILRPGCIYGPCDEQWAGRIGRLLAAGRLALLGRRGKGECNLVYVSDVTALITLALKNVHDWPAVQNIVASEAVTWNDMFSAYASALGLPAPQRQGRWGLLRRHTTIINQLIFSTLSDNWRDRITPQVLKLFCSRAEIRSVTGWPPAFLQSTSLAEGLAVAAAWLKTAPSFQQAALAYPTPHITPSPS